VSDEPRVIRQWRFQPPPGATEILLVRHGESEPAVIGTSFLPPFIMTKSRMTVPCGGTGTPPLCAVKSF
jgi:hypothetical protein